MSKEQYTAHFQTIYDKKDNDFIQLKITITPEIREVLRSVCVNMEEPIITNINVSNYSHNLSHNIQKKRYKVKGYIYGSIYESYKDILFLKDLMDKGTIKLQIPTIHDLDDVIKKTKDNIKLALELVFKHQDTETTVSYDIIKECPK